MIQIACIAVIKNEKGEVLTTSQKAIDTTEVFLPGGKIEENESCKECLVRELKEELGVDIQVLDFAGISESDYDGKEMTNLYYNAVIISGEPKSQEPDKIKIVEYKELEEVFNYKNIRWI